MSSPRSTSAGPPRPPCTTFTVCPSTNCLKSVRASSATRSCTPTAACFDDDFPAPHSRHTEVRAEDVRRTPNLRILAESDEAGLTLVESLDHSQVFMTGHLEYDRGTLDAEYRRDLARGMNPHVPSHYYPNDDPSQLPRMNWRAHAHLFYNNWLNYYVYQETPYDFVMQGQNS